MLVLKFTNESKTTDVFILEEGGYDWGIQLNGFTLNKEHSSYSAKSNGGKLLLIFDSNLESCDENMNSDYKVWFRTSEELIGDDKAFVFTVSGRPGKYAGQITNMKYSIEQQNLKPSTAHYINLDLYPSKAFITPGSSASNKVWPVAVVTVEDIAS